MSLVTTIIILFLQIITCFLYTITASSPHGFTIELIQRRSNSSLSRNQLTGSSPYADTFFDIAFYAMKLQVGNPPFEVELEIDTGSDLIWLQCLPCTNCYNQHGPIFDPSKSLTFLENKCEKQSCPYEIVYKDNTYSRGIYATETLTLHSTSGEPFVMAGTTIGCGHHNSGFRPSISGVVGMDWGPLSFITQMRGEYPGLFSYCFSGKGTSKINFGANAIVAGDGTVAADMFTIVDKPNFYYLNLDAISVGDNRIETLGTSFHADLGNMIIDSGTTYTFLPGTYCNHVREAVAKVVAANQVPDPSNNNKLCYSSSTIEIFPVITMHFSGGADLVLEKYNMYIESSMGGTFCLAIECVDPSDIAVFGNRAQNNFLVGYDISSHVVSFSPTDCSKLWS